MCSLITFIMAVHTDKAEMKRIIVRKSTKAHKT